VAQVAAIARRRWLLFLVGGIVLLFILFSALSGFYIDLLWFREVHFTNVFWTTFWSKVLLGAIFGLLFFALLLVNLLIVRRLVPRFRPVSPEQEVIERYRLAVEPYARRIIIGFSLLVALFVGIAASAQWQTFLLWRSRGPVQFGEQFLDPVFHRDPSFYIFVLPFQQFVQGWLFSALVGVTVIVVVTHYLTGGIRIQTPGEKVTPQVKAHVSVLLGLIMLVKAWGYYLGRFNLLTSPRGVVTGASYTDLKAELPALNVLMVIAVVCAILFLINIRFRGWILPILGIGLLALTSIVAGAIVPAIVQKFSVDPQEFQREEPYIARNISATRSAYGLDQIDLQGANVTPSISSADAAANIPTLSNVRLWDPATLRQNYDTLQRFQPYYEFFDVDVDRYNIDGQERVVMVSPREVSQNGIPPPGGTWQNKFLFYTHGYAAAASPVNTVGPSGGPLFELKDIPPDPNSGIPLQNGPGAQIYYGERNDVPYIVVGTKQDELNYPDPTGQTLNKTRYSGSGGIGMGSFFRKLVFAYHFRDINLLISGLIQGQSKILINRDIQDRVRKAAPFLRYDGDPYAAIVDGRIVYVWDAYTTTSLYPYSQEMDLQTVTNPRITGRVNYIRNSVKAVVDAYNGTVTFYVVDPTDPLIQVWERAFPGLFTTTPPPASLAAHFRYPENLLQVQATQFANYHVTDPQTFYGKERFWAIPNDPTLPDEPQLRPYYVLIKLPGETDEQFVLFIPFTPAGRSNMVAYLAARSDPESYGKLSAFQFTGGQNVIGPQQAFSLINQDPNFSSQRTLLGQGGSQVLFGNLLIIPVEESFLYVQPVFVVAGGGNSIPELKRVVLVNGGDVSVGNTFQDALALSVGSSQQPPPTQPPPNQGGSVSDLLQQALLAFQRADAALRAGDLATYQQEIDKAQQLIQQANQAAGGSTSPSPSPSPSPSASPSG